jgi:hypothetical protein
MLLMIDYNNDWSTTLLLKIAIDKYVSIAVCTQLTISAHIPCLKFNKIAFIIITYMVRDTGIVMIVILNLDQRASLIFQKAT